MFQRRCRRQTGFIRNRKKQTGLVFGDKQHKFSKETNCSFSPFKDSIMEPVEILAQTQRFSQYQPLEYSCYTSRNDLNRITNNLDSSLVLQSYRRKENFNQANYSDDIELFMRKTKSYQIQPHKAVQLDSSQIQQKSVRGYRITTQDEQIHFIDRKPPQFEEPASNMTLAEAFEANCKKMKSKLEYERRKFSKSKKKQNVEIEAIKSLRNTAPIKRSAPPRPMNVQSEPPRAKKGNTRSKQVHQSENNKQNNLNSQNKNPEKNTINETDKGVAFFVASQGNRGKPITKREAYEHSLKKWKQLPEVVAREKQKQKQKQLRERLSRVRAHSLEVRKKMRR